MFSVDSRRDTALLNRMSLLPLVRFWIWLSVIASAAGWILSAVGQLNRGGYAVVFAVAAAVFVVLHRYFDDYPFSLQPSPSGRAGINARPSANLRSPGFSTLGVWK